MLWKKVYVAHVPWVKVVDFVASKEIEEMCNVSSLGKVIERMNFYIIPYQTTFGKTRGRYFNPQL
jgi:hypothetical protein